MALVYFSMAGLWALGCALSGFLICRKVFNAQGAYSLAAVLPLLIPFVFLIGAIPTLALCEVYSQTLEVLKADEWSCTNGRIENSYTIAANSSQPRSHFVCLRYERIK